LARILLPLATTYGERRGLLLRLDPKNNKNEADDLQTRFNQLFDGVTKTGGTGPGAHPADQRKRDAAHLLLNTADVLSEDEAGKAAFPFDLNTDAYLTSAYLNSPAYQRAQLVTGLTAAVREVDDQAVVLEKMIAPALAVLDDDRNLFLAQYSRLLYALENMANDLQERTQFRDTKADEAAKMESLVKQRQEMVAQLKQQLKEAQKATQDRLADQATRENQIFGQLKALREAERKNQELEKEIEGLEGLGKKGK
jgi:hypothetical protein